jgi:hypothetical protein
MSEEWVVVVLNVVVVVPVMDGVLAFDAWNGVVLDVDSADDEDELMLCLFETA